MRDLRDVLRSRVEELGALCWHCITLPLHGDSVVGRMSGREQHRIDD